MPTIIRVAHRRDPYVVIDRRALEDTRLSWAAKAGEFTPEVGVAVAEGRERRHRTNSALERVSALEPKLLPANQNDPLVQRAERIRARAVATHRKTRPGHSDTDG